MIVSSPATLGRVSQGSSTLPPATAVTSVSGPVIHSVLCVLCVRYVCAVWAVRAPCVHCVRCALSVHYARAVCAVCALYAPYPLTQMNLRANQYYSSNKLDE